MAVSYRVFESLGLVHSVWSDLVTYEESVAYHEALRREPGFEPDMRQLVETVDAATALTGEEVRGLAKLSAFGPGARRAILVGDDEMYGITRMYAAQAVDAGEVGVFRDRDEALEWLGVHPCELADAIMSADRSARPVVAGSESRQTSTTTPPPRAEA